jgi:hypothetical protein
LAVHLHRGPDIPTTVPLASPGGLGWIGMTGWGLALVNNDLLTKATRPGVPSQALRRYALAAGSAAGSVDVLAGLPPVGGRSYLVADSFDAYTVELAAEATPSVTRHTGDTGNTAHTTTPSTRRSPSSRTGSCWRPSTRRALRASIGLVSSLGSTPTGSWPTTSGTRCRSAVTRRRPNRR